MPVFSKYNPPKTKNFRHALAWDLHQVLDIPFNAKRQPQTGYRIITAIVDAMRNALLRGETITIRGIGTFRVITKRRNRKRGDFILGTPYTMNMNPVGYTERRTVAFKPDQSLLNRLNYKV